jgi:20S proteasome alpha/beta subunit
MTLIIGVKCSDGVVIGADGAATFGNPLGQRTIIQPMAKLQVIQSCIVMGVSGQVGLSQLYCDRVEALWRDKKLGMQVSLADVMRLLHGAIYQDAQAAIAGAAASVPFLGNNAAAALAVTASIIALPVGGNTGRPELIQCNHLGMAEVATNDLPYVAIGSGQALADPFLAFLRHIFWPGSLPKLADGVFATVWTLLHAIRVTPGGVAEPIQVATLAYKGHGRELFAAEISTDHLQELRQHIQEAESYLANFRDSPQAPTSLPPPAPPQH